MANPFRFLSIHGKRSPLEVAGSPLNFLRGLLLTRAGNMNPLDGMDETYLKEDRSFIDAVLGRGEPSATCLDALRVLETLEALRMSLENGKSVKVKHRRT